MSSPKMICQIRDITFAHQSCSSAYNTSKHIIWDRDNIDPTKPVFFTDLCLGEVDNIQSTRKIAWLIEPPCINPYTYEFISHNLDKFDYVLTNNIHWPKQHPKFRYFPMGAIWIKPEDCREYEKTKRLSIIASNKNFAPGHQLRHKIVQRFGDQIDGLFGGGYTPIDYKLEGLHDYRFHLAVMNMQMDTYITDILLDALVTFTVPIFWGGDLTGFFNPDGIIAFNDVDELEHILPTLTPERYAQMLPAIRENAVLAERYRVAEDWIFKNHPELFT